MSQLSRLPSGNGCLICTLCEYIDKGEAVPAHSSHRQVHQPHATAGTTKTLSQLVLPKRPV